MSEDSNSNKLNNKPIIAVGCCNKMVDKHPSQSITNKYLDAIYVFGGIPILIPTNIEKNDLIQILKHVDGLMFTGSPSNVSPQRYGALHDESKLDLARDESSFTMIDYALKHNIPLLGICRGFQELNVSIGGTLHPKLHEVDGLMDHREDSSLSLDEQYSPTHNINIVDNSFLSGFGQTTYKVNSLHGQGVDKLGNKAIVQAMSATDGVVEAIKIEGQDFAFAVQWHPEWKAKENPLSKYIYESFIEYAKKYQLRKA